MIMGCERGNGVGGYCDDGFYSYARELYDHDSP